MKKLFVILLAMVTLASCGTLRQRTAATKSLQMKVIENATIVDLDVQAEKITYTYTPSRKERKYLGKDKIVMNAVAAALEQNGGGDVLIQPQYQFTFKSFGFRNIVSVTVTCYPATYKNFRKPTAEDLEAVKVFNGTNTNIVVENGTRYISTK